MVVVTSCLAGAVDCRQGGALPGKVGLKIQRGGARPCGVGEEGGGGNV
jgi:hypothetical protein